MNNEKETINKEEAAATLKSLASFKRDATKSFRMPLLLIMLISLSYSLIIFSFGMSEHGNMWGLGVLIGGAAFFIFIAFSVYTFRLLGIKVSVFPKGKKRIINELVLAVIFGVILIAGREFRVLGFEFSPHIAALIAGGLLAYLLYKYPTGEYMAMERKND